MWVLQDDGKLSSAMKAYANRFVDFLNDKYDDVESKEDVYDYFQEGLAEWIRTRKMMSVSQIDKFISDVGFDDIFVWFQESDLSRDFFSHRTDVWDFIDVALDEAFRSRVVWVD